MESIPGPSYDYGGGPSTSYAYGGSYKSTGAIPKYNRRLPGFRKYNRQKGSTPSATRSDHRSPRSPDHIPIFKKKAQKTTISYFKQLLEEDPYIHVLRRTRSVPSVLVGFGTDESVAQYLDVHKDFLRAYLVKTADPDFLQSLYLEKVALLQGPSGDVSRGNLPRSLGYCQHRKTTCDHDLGMLSLKRKLRKNQPLKWIYNSVMTSTLNNASHHRTVYNFVKHLCFKLGIDAIRIFVLDPDKPSHVQYMVAETRTRLSTDKLITADAKQTQLILEVAKKLEPMFVSRGMHTRFPETPQEIFQSLGLKHNVHANHILYLPILSGSGKCVFVAELWRVNSSFETRDNDHASSMSLWASVVLSYVEKFNNIAKRLEVADSMLKDVKSLFEDIVSLDQVIKQILELAQKLVKADRASLFMLDKNSKELVSSVFDLKLDVTDNVDAEKKEIRIPVDSGIAGHVACTGETMNISDAYKDPRFNRKIDQETGYKTNTILCMPIKVKENVVGVVQMVNKTGSRRFLRDDEVSFEQCAPFFGLALHHANLYEQIKRKEQQHRVTLDVLSYHNTSKEEDARELVRTYKKSRVNLTDYFLDPYRMSDMQKAKATLEMFIDLFGEYKFDCFAVARFVLTVKKNYRPVPYHNFNHGWSVANSMFVILKTDDLKRYSFIEGLALFVAAYCHDLDHRGFTNKYMSEIASPLAAIYSTSTLEHHHFNITATILQQEGHNIFSPVPVEDYKEILDLLRHNILSTDLATFFPNLTKLNKVDPQSFDWGNENHRKLTMSLCMTAADLSASTKPWRIQKKTVDVIFEEFYYQGDMEREKGKQPIPMMDRTKKHEQPASQVDFLTVICKPCYQKLADILPNTEPMYSMMLNNLKMWDTKKKNIEARIENNRRLSEDSSSSDSEGTLFFVSSPSEDEIYNNDYDEDAVSYGSVSLSESEIVDVIEVKSKEEERTEYSKDVLKFRKLRRNSL